MQNPIFTEEYSHCNHWHELTEDQSYVDFGTGIFVADDPRKPLLRALNECGLITRSHCYGHESDRSFVGILMDNDVAIEIRIGPKERSGRDFTQQRELLISWKRTD